MTTLGQDPNYRALASAAAAELGSSSPSIVAAILGQWQCEQRGPWPPTHNNPGFVTVSALRSVNVTSGTPARTSPGINFLAAFGSPAEGASAYAQLLARGRRYAGVRAAVAAGDGAAYLQAVTSAGYGTRYSCAIGAYKALGGKVAPSGAPPGVTGGATPADYLGAFGDIVQFQVGHVITATDVETAMGKLEGAAFFAKFLIGPGLARDATRAALTSAIGKPWDKALQDDLARRLQAGADQAGKIDPLGALFGGIGEAIGQGVFTLVVLGGIVVLGLLGIRRLAG